MTGLIESDKLLPMSKKLPFRTIKSWVLSRLGSLGEGQRTSFTSGDCPCFRSEVEGKPSDWKCGLSAERKGGVLLVNCFKPSCSLGGVAVKPESLLERLKAYKPREKTPEEELESGADGFTPLLSESAYEWLADNGVTRELAAEYGLLSDSESGRLIYFPVVLNRQLKYYQIRDLDYKTNGGLKWKGVYGVPSPVFLNKHPNQSDVLVIVEDMPSAIRLHDHCHAAALITTKMSTIKFAYIMAKIRTAKIKRVIIALDPGAENDAKKIKNALTNYCESVTIVYSDRDPKHWSDEETKQKIGATNGHD